MNYAFIYERGPNNWSAYVSDLPGCVAAETTREEVRNLIREAIELHIEGMDEDHEPIPQPGSWAEEIEVRAPERQQQTHIGQASC